MVQSALQGTTARLLPTVPVRSRSRARAAPTAQQASPRRSIATRGGCAQLGRLPREPCAREGASVRNAKKLSDVRVAATVRRGRQPRRCAISGECVPWARRRWGSCARQEATARPVMMDLPVLVQSSVRADITAPPARPSRRSARRATFAQKDRLQRMARSAPRAGTARSLLTFPAQLRFHARAGATALRA